MHLKINVKGKIVIRNKISQPMHFYFYFYGSLDEFVKNHVLIIFSI